MTTTTPAIKAHKNYNLVREFITHIPTYNTVASTLLSIDPFDYFIAECSERPNQNAIYSSNRILHQLSRAMEVDCIHNSKNGIRSNVVGCVFSTVNLENKYIPGYLYYK